ncbi:MAG: V-type ATPase 116kDa subunit family protein [Pseudomonadota bacterium]
MAIVPMKYVIVLGRSAHADGLIRELQRLGVIHPEKMGEEKPNKELEEASHNVREHAHLIEELKTYKPKPGIVKTSFEEGSKALLQKRSLHDKIEILTRERDRQAIWGDFDPSAIDYLNQKGIVVQLWQSREEGLSETDFENIKFLQEIVHKGSHYYITISGGKLEAKSADEIPIPEKNFFQVNEGLIQVYHELKMVEGKLRSMAIHLPTLKSEYENEVSEYEFLKAYHQSYSDGNLTAVGGWVPANKLQYLTDELKKFEDVVALKSRDPNADETPPVLTENSRFTKTFEPLLKLLGVPDYNSVDPATFFAPFMMLFFGICLGDAGYGAMMIVTAFIMRRYLAKKIPAIVPVTNLTMLFGVATIAWGLITGSIFGISFPQHERGWILFDVSSEFGNPIRLFYLSVALGVIHLSISFIISLLSAHKGEDRFASFGRIFVLWGGVLGVLKIEYWWALVSFGVAVILFMSSSSHNPFKRVGLGLWNIYGLTSLIGDVMSYARLFGLGIATGAIASVVNQLAMQAGEVPYAGILFTIIILIIGHGFNFAMGIVGALVHPGRLHAVEAIPKFAELTGVPYKPLIK